MVVINELLSLLHFSKLCIDNIIRTLRNVPTKETEWKCFKRF